MVYKRTWEIFSLRDTTKRFGRRPEHQKRLSQKFLFGARAISAFFKERAPKFFKKFVFFSPKNHKFNKIASKKCRNRPTTMANPSNESLEFLLSQMNCIAYPEMHSLPGKCPKSWIFTENSKI